MLLLSGCWDRSEINDVAFVLSTAVDLEKDGKIRFSVLVPLPGKMGGPGGGGGGGGTGGEKSYYIDSEIAETFREAQMKLQKRMSRRMFLAHRRTILIGENFAKNIGIQSIFDGTPRSPESRMSTYLIIAKGYAYDLLDASPRFERFPSEAIRELAKDHTVADMNMKDVGLPLSSSIGDPVAVYMDIKKSQKGEKPSKEVEVKGYALFRGDKMIGTLENEEADGYSWLHNWNIKGSASFKVEGEHTVTIKIFDTKTRIKTRINNGRIDYSIHSDARAKLLEDRSFFDLSQTKNVNEVEKAAADHVKKCIQAFLDRSIKTSTDPVQLGAFVWRAYPEQWEQAFKGEWPQAMKDASFSIHVETKMMDTGLIYENVTKRRDEK
ncbi:Ger(x)C family spore germination protein [Paenibacillus piri]|uniref:Ger(X)C family spore germination protein n=2 Tax=Paenibacillus piri TaxID=2547395 RepID=A0A4R5KEW6_9BACL|nr:Ger(x)C family spore germination protein [Paenibacillus piri]